MFGGSVMFLWGLLMVVLIVASLGAFFYLTERIRKFSFIKKNKWAYQKWCTHLFLVGITCRIAKMLYDK